MNPSNPAAGPVDSAAGSGRDWPRLLPWLLALAGVLCYVNALPTPFVFDDSAWIVHERLQVQSVEDFGELLRGRRPVVMFSLWVNYLIDGLNPAGYHLFNVVVHVLAGLTLYGLVRRTLLLPKFGGRFTRSAAWLAAAAALLWLVHPLNTQAVTYTIQRAESMMGLFYLLTLYCVVRGVPIGSRLGDRGYSPELKRGGSWRRQVRPGWLIAAVAACAAGMGSKEVMVTAPVMVLVYDRMFLAGTFPQALRRRWPLYVGLAATWGLIPVMGLGDVVSSEGSAGFAMPVIRPMEYLISQGEVILYYLRLAVWPHPLVLDYQWLPAWLLYERGMIGPTRVIVPPLAVAGLLAVALVGVWRNAWWGFVGFWFFGVLSISSSIIPIGDVAVEHRMYLPLAGLIVLAVVGGHLLLRRLVRAETAPTLGVALVLVLAAALGAATVTRNYEYGDDVLLWQTVTDRAPMNPRGYYNYGHALMERGEWHVGRGEVDQARARYREALSNFEHVIEMGPVAGLRGRAHYNLVEIWLEMPGVPRQRRIREARQHLDRTLRINPEDADAHHKLGEIRLMRGDVNGAAAAFERALELKPRYPSAYANLGQTRIAQDRPEDAQRLLERAIELDPSLVSAWVNLASLMLNTGRPEQAAGHYEEALSRGANSPAVLTGLGTAYLRMDRLHEAAYALERAIQAGPAYVPAYAQLGLVSDRQGDGFTARSAYQRALELDPDQPGLRVRLAMLLATHPRGRLRDPEYALKVLQPLEEVAPEDPAVLEAKAAAQAALGRFEPAVEHVRRALSAAEGQASADENQLRRLRQALKRYEAEKPYIDRSWRERFERYQPMDPFLH